MLSHPFLAGNGNFRKESISDTSSFILYISIVIGTYLSIDLAKIFLAKQFHDKLTEAGQSDQKSCRCDSHYFQFLYLPAKL